MKKFIVSSVVAGLILGTFTGCLKEKKMPTEKIVTIYDSNLKETNKLSPLDTMYVKIGGVEPNTLHEIDILDPNEKLISKVRLKSDSEGVIGPVPVWYDVGVVKEGNHYKIAYDADIAVKSFYVKVKSLDNDATEFKQPFFVLLKRPSNDSDVIKPVVSAVDIDNKLSHTFFETGSKAPDGSESNLTKVFVRADVLPNRLVDGSKVDSVDIYVVPFTGVQFEDGMDLENVAVTSVKDVPVEDAGNYATLNKTLVWDLNKDPKLINPGDSNNAFSIIIDTNKDGKLEIGKDLDGDGQYDKYIDAIAGQGAAGFVVLNTEANEIDYKITDEEGNKVDAIGDHLSGDNTALYLNMNNVPTQQRDVRVYVVDEDAVDLPDGFELRDVRDSHTFTTAQIDSPDNNNTFMPYIKMAKLIDTKGGDTYSYTQVVNRDKKLDVVVDMNNNGLYDKEVDYYIPNAVTITPFNGDIYTVTSNDDKTTLFNEANSDSNTTVYIKVSGEKLSCDDLKYAYLFPISKTPEAGDELFGEILRKEVAINAGCKTKFLDTNETYADKTFEIINPTDENNKYVIVVDKNDDHKYDEGDSLLYITFKDTPANDLPDVSYINLASGGLMGEPYTHWLNTPYTSAYDYRDIFTVDAENTMPSEFYWYARYYTTPGVKVVWNAYIRDKAWWSQYYYGYYIDEKQEEHTSPFYEGQLVDLYIISADDYKLRKNMQLSDDMDVRGYHNTMHVQFGCRNGYNLQTVWEAPLKVGRYYMVVDVNRNGKIDDGIDVIDAVTKTGVTIKDDPTVVGFSVVE